jgi:[acyl-carrier-protein] S-malonyltransferase
VLFVVRKDLKMAHFAFLFPGQGSQSKGMLDAFVDSSLVRSTLEEASDALGYDMAALIRDDVDEKLGQTEYTQPALLTASTAVLRLWREQGGREPTHVAGHSLGEYSALVAAGTLGFVDAVQLVSFRGRSMTEAVPAGVGRMAAILGLADDVLEGLCEQVSTETEQVWPVNYNCPGQLVVAGHATAVDLLIETAKQAGARRALPLAVSAPSHTPLMRSAADAMAARLQEIVFHEPSCPVWTNVDASARQGIAEIRAALVEQLVSPVRWTETIQGLRGVDVLLAVEMGPGKVLAGLGKRISRDIAVNNVLTPEQLAASIVSVAASE